MVSRNPDNKKLHLILTGNKALYIHTEATRPIVPEDNTDLNGFTADPLQAPYQPQQSVVHGEPWIALPT
ncbi:UNVERIFIED_CONTAM: hypothetical protein FKN15_060492 [Acipenser sinensis]